MPFAFTPNNQAPPAVPQAPGSLSDLIAQAMQAQLQKQPLPPAFSEGQVMPPQQPVATDVQREFDAGYPSRTEPLEQQLWLNRVFPQYDTPVTEGSPRPAANLPLLGYSTPPSTYPQPLPPGYGRGPLGLY